uniref:Threonine synthase n=2 Tax=Hemiselmis andersenii TaxID=464988 RepID=A0A6U4LG57_HEMAN
MLFRSTRGAFLDMTFEEAVFEGLAQDGGLLVPHFIPDLSGQWKKWKNLPFDELAFEIAKPWVGEEIPEEDLRSLMKRSYATFSDKDVVPTRSVGGIEIMELFHGPTYAFKDVALQALGNLFEYFLTRSNKRITVVGATSGDTGSAAIYGLRGKKNVECFILFPEGRVSPIQQMQMTSVLDPNVHCVAVQGTFDDCQDIVKALFRDLKFKKQYSLGAVNSINIARIMFQITYYFYTYFKAFPNCDGEMSFSVPTGNFGDILAGYYAKRMGLPVRHLLVATNSNDILDRFFTTGQYNKYPVVQTFSPSMDIGISSNFERYLFYLFGEDSQMLKGMMDEFNRTGKLEVDAKLLATAKQDFLSACCSEQDTIDTIASFHKQHGYTLDPHTACGVRAVQTLEAKQVPQCTAKGKKHVMVVLSTAHPAKFSMAVSKATGAPPTLPPGLAACQDSEVRFQVMPASTPAIKGYIETTIPDFTGQRNVYTPTHILTASTVVAAVFVAGVLVGKNL